MNEMIATEQLATAPGFSCGRPVKTVKAEIILGSPSSGCEGVGICRVMGYGELRQLKCRKVTAWITVSDQNKLQVCFWKPAMEAAFVQQHFSNRQFQVKETYDIPGRIGRAIGLNSCVISPGTYTVRETASFLTVEF